MKAVPIPVAEYVAFDLETTGLSPDTDEILEVAMVRFTGGEPSERWSSLVNPGKPVPLKTLRLTHINPAELLASRPLGELLPALQEFRLDLPLVGHKSAFDAAFLAKRIEGFPGVPVYDTLELARLAVPDLRSYKLADLARELGVMSQEAHRAYDDAEVSGVIFRIIQEAVARIPEGARARILCVMGQRWGGAPVFAVPLGSRGGPAQPLLLGEPGGAVTLRRRVDTGEEAAVAGIRQVLRGPFGAVLSGTGRIAAAGLPLARSVARAVALEAKEWALAQGKRVLFLGFPHDVLPDDALRAGLPEDYVCLARLEEAFRQAEEGAYAGLDPEQRRFLASLFQWVETTAEGALAELQMGSGGFGVAPEVACPPSMASSVVCQDSCPKASSCFYLKAFSGEDAALAKNSGRVLFAPLERGFRLALGHDLALVWGAQDVARAWQAGEPRVDLTQLKEALSRSGVAQDVKSLPPLLARANADMGAGGVASPETLRLGSSAAIEIEAAVTSLRGTLQAAFQAKRTARDDGSAWVRTPLDPPLVWRDLHMIEKCAGDLRRFLGNRVGGGAGATPATPHGSALCLVEQGYGDEGPRGPVLAARAVWPAASGVNALLAAAGGRALLLSDVAVAAYESEGGRRMLGLDLCERAPADLGPAVSAAEGEAGAPAEHSAGGPPGATKAASLHRVLLAVLDSARAVTPAAYSEYLKGLLTGLGLRVRKGLLVAFPSRALLKETYAAIQPELEEEGIAVYGQGIDGGRRVVEHLEEDDAVVLAMAGAGPSADDPVPSCLVVTRVPFAPPNPLDDARRAQIAASGGDGFVEVNVRPAALVLRCHVERMVRSGKRCAVVLADPKLLPRRSNWGQEFMAAFSGIPRLVCPELDLLSRVGEWVRG